jgi:hypothetical protein
MFLLDEIKNFIIYLIIFILFSLFYGSTVNKGIFLYITFFSCSFSAYIFHKIKFEPGIFFAVILSFNYNQIAAFFFSWIALAAGNVSVSKLIWIEDTNQPKTRYARISFISSIFLIVILGTLLKNFPNILLFEIIALLIYSICLFIFINFETKGLNKKITKSIYKNMIQNLIINLILLTLFGQISNNFITQTQFNLWQILGIK